jgi:hypothetical protein
MESMFENSLFRGSISTWDLSNVTERRNMFYLNL